jgi:hypothetical protein
MIRQADAKAADAKAADARPGDDADKVLSTQGIERIADLVAIIAAGKPVRTVERSVERDRGAT